MLRGEDKAKSRITTMTFRREDFFFFFFSSVWGSAWRNHLGDGSEEQRALEELVDNFFKL